MMNPNFDAVASSILQESIKSAIFIDDCVLLPFEKSTDPNILDYSNLLPPFQDKGCTLSFYRFDNDWKEKTSFIFDNRDLLILDWQLKKNQDTYSDTLAVLQQAVSTDSLHFCCVYTETNPSAFVEKIVFPVLFYFGYSIRLDRPTLATIKEKFVSLCDQEGLDAEDIIKYLNPLLREYTLYSFDSVKRARLTNEILNYLKQVFKNFRELRAQIVGLTGDLGKSFTSLAYSFEEQSIPICEIDHKVRIGMTNSDSWRIYVNNTIITIANKGDIQEQLFYREFKIQLWRNIIFF